MSYLQHIRFVELWEARVTSGLLQLVVTERVSIYGILYYSSECWELRDEPPRRIDPEVRHRISFATPELARQWALRRHEGFVWRKADDAALQRLSDALRSDDAMN